LVCALEQEIAADHLGVLKHVTALMASLLLR
jgi:hypothetical protein